MGWGQAGAGGEERGPLGWVAAGVAAAAAWWLFTWHFSDFGCQAPWRQMAPCTSSVLLLHPATAPALLWIAVLPSILPLPPSHPHCSSPSPACSSLSWGIQVRSLQCVSFPSPPLWPHAPGCPSALGASPAPVPVPNTPVRSFPGGCSLSPHSSPPADACSFCTSRIQAKPSSQPSLAGPHQCYVTGLRQPSPVASRALGEG